jgi:hypothetical protein
MRVDELVQHLRSEYPKPSSAHDKFYSNIWNPADYPIVPKQENVAVSNEELNE